MNLPKILPQFFFRANLTGIITIIIPNCHLHSGQGALYVRMEYIETATSCSTSAQGSAVFIPGIRYAVPQVRIRYR